MKKDSALAETSGRNPTNSRPRVHCRSWLSDEGAFSTTASQNRARAEEAPLPLPLVRSQIAEDLLAQCLRDVCVEDLHRRHQMHVDVSIAELAPPLLGLLSLHSGHDTPPFRKAKREEADGSRSKRADDDRKTRPCLVFEIDTLGDSPNYLSGDVSEIVSLRRADLHLDRTSSVRVQGKGRKERVLLLWKDTASALKKWLPRIASSPDAPLLPNRAGRPLTRSGVEHRLDLAVARAAEACPSLKGRRISPHTIRHTTAMHLLQSGVHQEEIALWLGHEDPSTTHHYVEADLAMKERALSKVHQPEIRTTRYRPSDRILAYLEGL